MSERVSFHQGSNLLQGRFHAATGGNPTSTVLLLQGSPGHPEDVLGLGHRLSQRSCNVLTFNYSGTLESEGLSSFENAQLDIAAAGEYLATRGDSPTDTDKLVIGGWSYGGGMALTYAANHLDIPAAFSIAGTDHGAFMREYASDPRYREMVDQIFEEMAGPSSPWRVAPGATPREAFEQGAFLEDFDLVRLAPRLADRPTLLIGGWDDRSVKIENHVLPLYRELSSQGANDVSLVAFQDDHSFGRVRDELANTLHAWITKVSGRNS